MLDVEALSEMMASIISEEVEKAVVPLNARIAELEARPVGSQMDDIKGVVEIMISDAFVVRSASSDPEQMASLVAEQVERAVAAIPAPQDGKSVGVEDVAPLIAAEMAKAVAQIPVPKDGVDGNDGRDGSNGKDGRGVKDLLIDRDGHLVATMDDGEMKNLGPVIGKDGAHGKDGHDGFGFEDMDVAVLDDDRTIELSFRRGDEVKAFTLKWPTVIDRGIWKEGHPYSRGDSVTWGGSSWIAQQDEPPGKPDTKDSGWRLAVKKGRDGKDSKNG